MTPYQTLINNMKWMNNHDRAPRIIVTSSSSPSPDQQQTRKVQEPARRNEGASNPAAHKYGKNGRQPSWKDDQDTMSKKTRKEGSMDSCHSMDMEEAVIEDKRKSGRHYTMIDLQQFRLTIGNFQPTGRLHRLKHNNTSPTSMGLKPDIKIMMILAIITANGGWGHSGPCGWWMSIPASRSSIYPLPPLCNLYNLLKELVTDSSTQTFYAASLG